MLDFRKVFLAIAAVAALGLANTASAQTVNIVSCATVSNSNMSGPNALGAIRAEGMTEQIPPISVSNCTSTADSGVITFAVNTNAPVTNAQLTGTTTAATDAVAIFCGITPSAAQSAAPTVSCNGGTGYVVAGNLTGAQQLTFTFSVVPGASASSMAVFVENVRVNASGMAAGTTFTQTVAAVSGIAFIGSGVGTVTSAVSQTSLSSISFTGYPNVALCQTTSGQVNAVGVVGIGDAFTGAFSTDAQEYAKETNSLASLVANNPITSSTTVGSRLSLTFSNLNAGVTYYVPVSVTNGNLTLFLVPAANSPCGSASNACTSAVAGGSIGTSGTGNTAVPVAGVYGFTASATGTATVYYAVANDSNGAALDKTGSFTSTPSTGNPAAAAITLYETIASASSVVPVTAAPAVLVSLAGASSPYYAEFLASTATPKSAAASSSFPTTSGSGILAQCSTTMLFPYLVTSVGYDTGIAITNTGSTASVIGNTIVSTTNGSCSLQLYGAGSLNGTPISPVLSPITLSVMSGQVNAMNLSMLLPSTQPTFVGYGVAVCNFQGGHGFAQISNGSAGFSEGYLAPVLADVFNGTFGAVSAQQF